MAITIDRSYLQGISDECAALDIEFSASTPGSGKRAVINRIASEDTTDISALINYMRELPNTASRLAVYTNLQKAIDEEFDAEFDALITPQITTATVSTLSEADRAEKVERRKQLQREWIAVTTVWPLIAKGADADISDIKVPGKLTMLRGSRGPRAINDFQFVVGGVVLSKAENSLKKIAARFTKTDKDGNTVVLTARDLREFGTAALKAEGVELNWTTPPENFQFILPDGVTMFQAYKATDETDDDGDDD